MLPCREGGIPKPPWPSMLGCREGGPPGTPGPPGGGPCPKLGFRCGGMPPCGLNALGGGLPIGLLGPWGPLGCITCPGPKPCRGMTCPGPNPPGGIPCPGRGGMTCPGPNPPGGITCPGPKPGPAEVERGGKPCCTGPIGGDCGGEGPMLILPMSPDSAASASAAAAAEFVRDGGPEGSLDRRECELAGDIARGGLIPPLRRSGCMSAEECWLRSCGTEGGREPPLPMLFGMEGRAGTGGGGFLEEGNTTKGAICQGIRAQRKNSTHARRQLRCNP